MSFQKLIDLVCDVGPLLFILFRTHLYVDQTKVWQQCFSYTQCRANKLTETNQTFMNVYFVELLFLNVHTLNKKEEVDILANTCERHTITGQMSLFSLSAGSTSWSYNRWIIGWVTKGNICVLMSWCKWFIKKKPLHFNKCQQSPLCQFSTSGDIFHFLGNHFSLWLL